MTPTPYVASCDDDESAKVDSAMRTPEASQKNRSAFGFLKDVCIFFIQYPIFLGFAFFAVTMGAAYISVGRPVTGDEFGKFASSNLEILGLTLLRHKIQKRESVAGISGTTILMYAFVYTQRIVLSLPHRQVAWKDLDFDVSFGCVSLILVLDIVKSIWFTHYSTYQSELEVLKAQYIIPGCYLAALLVRPDFQSWPVYFGYAWTSCLYMDALALLPQVVMMAQGGGKVQVPIAHFVAATFLSRANDLWDTLGVSGAPFREDNMVSYSMVIFMQAFHLLVVADFIYYYIKARGHRCTLVQEVNLIADDMC